LGLCPHLFSDRLTDFKRLSGNSMDLYGIPPWTDSRKITTITFYGKYSMEFHSVV